METRPPTAVRVLIAFGFAVSCFALALFLWIAFGGPVPLKPEGYRFTVPFDEATQLAQESDVRISGVSIGKVKRIDLNDEGQAEATVELDADYAPIPADTRAMLRQKTLLGETYIELTPGSEDSEPLPEGADLGEAQTSDAVQLDEIFRAFDEETRQNFRVWMQSQAAAFGGRGADVSAALASLEPLVTEADTTLRVLDSQRLAVERLVRDGGEVFGALSERKGQLRGLITNANEVFAATAARNEDLAETFRIFPTFLRESRATLARLERFALESDPVVQDLRPAARELSPTFIALAELAPDLGTFFRGLDRVISESRPGFGALRELLRDELPRLITALDPYMAEVNSILAVLRMYRRELAGTVANVAAVFNGFLGLDANLNRLHYLRTEAPLSPETMAAFPHRLDSNRTNPYLKPGRYLDVRTALRSFETRHCTGAGGITATLDPADAGAFPGDLFDRIRQYAFGGALSTADVPAPPCLQQAPYRSIGVNPETTRYLHVREQP